MSIVILNLLVDELKSSHLGHFGSADWLSWRNSRCKVKLSGEEDLNRRELTFVTF